MTLLFILLIGMTVPRVFAQDLPQADLLFKNALKLQKKAAYEQSNTLLKKAVALFKAEEKRVEVSKCYNELGFNTRSLHDLDKAELFSRKVLALEERYDAVPPGEIAAAYHNLGLIASERSDFKEALGWLRKGLSLKAQIPVQIEAGLITGIGSVYHDQGKYDLAMDQFRSGVELLEVDNPNHQKRLAILYNYVGVNFASMGEYEKALLFYRKELEMNLALYGEGHPYVAATYNNLGGLSYRKGDIGRAIGYFRKAANSFKQRYGENHPRVGMAYNNIGVSFFKLGKHQKATEYLIKSAEIKKKVRGPNHPGLAVTYNNIGSIFLQMKKYKEAKNYLTRALAIRKKVLGANHPQLTNTYNSLGILYLKQNQPDSAISYFEREVEITRKHRGKRHPYVSDALNNIAKAYAAQDFFEQALTFHQQALKVLSESFAVHSYADNPRIRTIRYPTFAVKVLFDKAKSLYKYFEHSKNISLLKAALTTYHRLSNLLDFLQTGFMSTQSKLLMSRESHEIYGYAIRTAYWLFKETNRQRYLEEAFYFAEKSKTRVILELIKNQQAKKFGGVPDSLIRYEDQLHKRLTETQQQLNHSIETVGEGERVSKLRDSLFVLKRSLDRHLRYLEKEFPRYHSLRYNNSSPEVDSIQRSLQKQNLTLVEYFYGKESAWAFVMDTNNLSLTPLPYDSALTENIRRFRRSITQQSDSLYLNLAFKLYEELLQPVVRQIQGNNILFVPDGVLNLLPFEALLVQSVEQYPPSFADLPYLINYFSISYSPSVSLSALSQTPPDYTYTSDFAAFAPIHFSTEAEVAGTRGEGRDWPPLPSTGYEVREIAELFESDTGFWNIFGNSVQSRLFLGKEATEEAFKLANLGNYRFLHLATHAFAADTGAYRSGIVFHPGDNPYEDGILYVEEVYNLDLQSKLAVLSACETGTGRVMKGEGIIGLSRAFKYAGVENLLVSLWKVDDRSTAQLMIDFYRRWINGASFPRALRSAKRELIAHPAYAHPKFWAPFIFIGR